MFKRILVISPEFSQEYTIYQPWKQVFEICKRLKIKGIDIAIGTNATTIPQIQGINIISFTEHKLRKLGSSSINKIHEFNPDVILWIGNPLSGTYLKKLNLNSIPIVLYISTIPITFNEIKNFSITEVPQLGIFNLLSSLPFFRNIIQNLNHKNISGIIVPNNTIKKSLIRVGVLEKKIKVSPLCFELENIFSDIDIKNKHSTDFTICYLGPVYSIRGVDLLLDVIKLLKQNNYKVKLNFLLRTKEVSKDQKILFKKCKSRNIQDCIDIKSGILDRKNLFNEILNSDVIVIPTKFVWNEPPLAILEAMKLGKLVITSNVCGLAELINSHGFALDLNPQSFFNCIQNLIENKELLKKMELNGQNFVNSLPDWNYFADWLISTLDNFKFKTEQ